MNHWKLWAALAASAVWLNSASAQAPVLIALPDEPVAFEADEKKEGDKPEKVAAPMEVAPAADAGCCDEGCGKGKCKSKHKCKCPIVWCRPWTCEDLEMKPFEPVAKHCCKCRLLWCVKDEEKKNGNGNGEKKNGEEKKDEKKNGEKKDEKKDEAKKDEKEEKKNGEAEEKAEEEPKTKTPLMQILECCKPCKFKCFEEKGNNLYGWIQGGFSGNAASPDDRINFGRPFAFRSNDFMLNQAYLVLENTLEQEDKSNVGYRIDILGGTDAPYIAANGLFDHVTGLDTTSGILFLEGAGSNRHVNRIGFDIPQMYIEGHIPLCCGNCFKSVDIRVGKAYTSMGYELLPAISTDFYSHSYEFFHAVPFTHTGVFATWHVTDTLDIMTCVARGWDVWEDNNSAVSYHGAFIWNSCDKRKNWTTAWITGPEQWEGDQLSGTANPGADDNFRTVITSYFTCKFGCYNQWKAVVGGNIGWERNVPFLSPDGVTAANPLAAQDAEWYGASAYLFYTVDPRLTLGMRAEWFRDDDAARTAYLTRPGFDSNFYEVTFGFTYKPKQNLRIRPEVRFDWADNGTSPFNATAQPFNDQQDKTMFTFGFDVIYEF